MLGEDAAPDGRRVRRAARRGGHVGQVRGAERDRERFVDALEHLVHAAWLGSVAVLEVVGAGARHLEQRPLERADRLGHGDLAGRAREAVAAGLPAGRAHEARSTQVTDELLEISVRHLLAARDLGQREAALTLVPGERDEDPDAVLGAGADLHSGSSLTLTSSPSITVW